MAYFRIKKLTEKKSSPMKDWISKLLKESDSLNLNKESKNI